MRLSGLGGKTGGWPPTRDLYALGKCLRPCSCICETEVKTGTQGAPDGRGLVGMEVWVCRFDGLSYYYQFLSFLHESGE